MTETSVSEIVTDALTGSEWWTIVAAFGAYFVLSFIWWGPLFGRRWATEMGMDIEAEQNMPMAKPLIYQAVGTFLMAYVFWHILMAFSLDTADMESTIQPSYGEAIMGAVWIWAGFVVPAQLGKMAWEKGTVALALINGIGHLVGLIGMAVVMAAM